MLRRITFIAVLSLTLLMLLAACGGAGDEATPTPSGSGGADGTPTSDLGGVDLPGTSWVLISLEGEELPSEVTVTLAFEDGQFGGNAGCNAYGGEYTADNAGELSISQPHNTDMDCAEPPGIMELESRYLETLPGVASYRATEAELELLDADGEAVLVFAAGDTSELDGTSWQVVELDGEPLIDGTEITLTFEDGRVKGSAGCNTYGGPYIADDERLTIASVEITEMGCLDPEGVMDQELAYVDALIQSTTYRLSPEKNQLEILDASGQVRVVFASGEEPRGTAEPSPTVIPGGTPPIAGTEWVLTHIRGQEVDPDPPATLLFRANQYTGQFGCLVYSGPIEISPTGDVLEMPIHNYDDDCNGVMIPDMAETYLAALAEARQYRLDEDRLEFLDAAGKILLTYRPALPGGGELDGTEWTLVELDGQPLVPETEITLSFTEGRAVGDAGCNTYGGDYAIIEEGVISIPEIAMTAMACAEPPGVMEQETAYHQALAHVTRYRLADDRLELMDESGEMVLKFERQATGD